MGLGLFALVAMGSKKKSNGNGAQPAGTSSLKTSEESKQRGATDSADGQAGRPGKKQSKGISSNEIKARKASIKALDEKMQTNTTLTPAITAAIGAYKAIQPELAAAAEPNQDFAATLGELSKFGFVPMDLTTAQLEDMEKRAEEKYEAELKKLQTINAEIAKLSESPDGESKSDELKAKRANQVAAVKSASSDHNSREKTMTQRQDVDRLIIRLRSLAR